MKWSSGEGFMCECMHVTNNSLGFNGNRGRKLKMIMCICSLLIKVSPHYRLRQFYNICLNIDDHVPQQPNLSLQSGVVALY